MNEPELKPFPFCSGMAEIMITSKNKIEIRRKGTAYLVRCKICRASSVAEFDKNKAVERWNERVKEEPYRKGSNMRRLTARNRKGFAYFPQCFEEPCCGFGCQIEPCGFIWRVCEKLAQYEDAEERGEDHAKGGRSQRTTIPETGKEKETEKA